ncbi:MAG TPA: PnuC protein [Nanoarchaeota archaeon]|nr:PnuC protein [Candidatus Woesearchaeota archaeon]HIH15655.1 PnuC protein [Nanoarchaeota archaeon]HIH58764.1 PnuC protein [Nanoarchaeota archaeon]HII13686.1 PnuC protein [Nanoarchaeota archaeon]HIJ05378.1 PnuC protein [Nanoarchaeota archaeon]
MDFSFFTNYYGIDILAMLLTFLGIYTIGNKKRYGFLIALTGNILWTIIGILSQSAGLLFANSVLVILYIRAYVLWKKRK